MRVQEVLFIFVPNWYIRNLIMRQQEFILDLVEPIKEQINSEESDIILMLMDRYRDPDGRIRYSLNDDDKKSFLPWNKVKVGDVILVDDPDDPKSLVNRARVDHKYRNCIFTTWLEGYNKGKHHMFFKGSWIGLNGSYPCKIIVPKEVNIVNLGYVDKLTIEYI